MAIRAHRARPRAPAAWARAPARGGSRITASRRSSAGPASGARSRSRPSAVIRSPKPAGAPRGSARQHRGLRHRPPCTRRPAAASGRPKVPQPANRSAIRRGIADRLGRPRPGSRVSAKLASPAGRRRAAGRPRPRRTSPGPGGGPRSARPGRPEPGARRARARSCARGERRQRPRARRGRAAAVVSSRSSPLSVAGDLHLAACAASAQAAQQLSERRQQATISGQRDRAFGNVDQVVTGAHPKAEPTRRRGDLESQADPPPARGRRDAGGATSIASRPRRASAWTTVWRCQARNRRPADAAADSRRRCRNARQGAGRPRRLLERMRRRPRKAVVASGDQTRTASARPAAPAAGTPGRRRCGRSRRPARRAARSSRRPCACRRPPRGIAARCPSSWGRSQSRLSRAPVSGSTSARNCRPRRDATDRQPPAAARRGARAARQRLPPGSASHGRRAPSGRRSCIGALPGLAGRSSRARSRISATSSTVPASSSDAAGDDKGLEQVRDVVHFSRRCRAGP